MSKQHARFSPSKLEGLEQCPKFERAPIEDAADEGELLHKAAEAEDLGGLMPEQRSAVSSALQYVGALAAAKPGAKIEKEIKLELKDLTYGFADWIAVWGDYAEVVDFKFGRVEVTPAAKNLQVQSYAAALMEMRPEIQKVRCHVVQPRVGSPNFAEFDRSLVDVTRARIELVYSRSGDPFTAPTPGDHCARCTWAHKCPALKPALVQMAETFSMPVPAVLRGEIEPTPQDRYALQMLATLLEKVAGQWKDGNRKAWFELGIEIPGLAVRERATSRVRQDQVAEALKRLRDAGYATEQQLIGCLKMSIPDLANQMVEIRGGTSKEERARILEVLGDLVEESVTRFLAKAAKGKGS